MKTPCVPCAKATSCRHGLFLKLQKNPKKIQYAMRAVCESHRMSTGIFVDFFFCKL